MAELNVITREKAEKVKARRTSGSNVQPASNGCVNSRAPFFCDYVVDYLLQDPPLGETAEAERKQPAATPAASRSRPRSTCATRRRPTTSVAAHVYPTDQAIGALAMVEPGTGNVQALAQSRPMGSEQEARRDLPQLHRPKEYGDSNGFQAGSTFKAFVLAAAIKQGIPLNTDDQLARRR